MDNAHEAQKDNIGFSLNYSFSEMTEEAQQQIKDAAAEICKDISGHLDLSPVFQKYKEFPTTELAAQIVLADAIDTLTQNASFSQLCEIISKESNADKIFPIMESAAEKAGKAALVDPYKIVILCGGMDALKARINNDFLNTFLDGLPDNAKETINLIARAKEFQDNETYKKIKAGFAQILFLFREYQKLLPFFSEKDTDNFLRDTADPRSSLLYYIALEMDESQDPDISQITVADLLRQGLTESREPAKNKFGELIERAQKRQAADAAAQTETPDAIPTKEDLPHVTYRNSKQLKTVTDKLMNNFFAITAPISKELQNGQRAMIPVKYEGNKSKKEITLYYDFSYNDDTLSSIGIPKGFSSYDYFVATILDNLYEHGNDRVSINKILEEMGFTDSNAGGKQAEKLVNALIRGATTTIHIDDFEVQRAWGNDRYTEFVGAVFPIMLRNERFLANGRIADGTVKINGFSPFHMIADNLGHLTSWNKEILQLYTGRKTDRYWNVLHFLIREIGWMRNPNSKRSRKIRYSTLYNCNGDKTARTQQLTRDMLFRLLDEVFIPAGYIKAYKEDNRTEPGVTLTIGNPPLLPN